MQNLKTFLRFFLFGLIFPLWTVVLLGSYFVGCSTRALEWISNDTEKDPYAFIVVRDSLKAFDWIRGEK